MMYNMLESIASFIECYLLCLVISTIMGNKKQNKKLLGCSLFLTATIFLINQVQLYSISAVIILPTVVATMFYLLFKNQMKYTASITILYLLLIYLIDFITLSIVGLIFKDSHLVIGILQYKDIQRLIYIVLCKLELLLIYAICKKYLTKIKFFRGFELIVILATIAFFGASLIINQTTYMFDSNIALTWILYGTLLILSLSLIVVYLVRKYEKSVLSFTKSRNELLEKNYQQLKNIYEKNAKMFHDFNHHIKVIQDLSEKNCYQELNLYLANFHVYHNQAEVQWTEDKILNFILNSKIEEGKHNQIQFDMNIDYPINTNLAASDITTILANLLDNAIESCIGNQENQRVIKVVIRKIQSMLFIKISNSCNKKPQKKHGRYLTTKNDTGFHGWGLKSVETTVEKYNGSITYEYENQIFHTNVSLVFDQLVN